MEGISCTLLTSPKEKEQFLNTTSPAIIAFPRHICPLYTIELRIHLLPYFYVIAFVYRYYDDASTVFTAVRTKYSSIR